MRVVTILSAVLLTFSALAGPAFSEEELKKSHRQAAADLLKLMDAENQAMAGANAMADVMLQSNPMLGPFRDVITDWSAKVMTWDNMMPKMVALYAETYTEGELKELIAFYSTKLGQKMIRVTPELTRKGAMIGSELAQQHMGELQAAIEARANEMQQLGTTSP